METTTATAKQMAYSDMASGLPAAFKPFFDGTAQREIRFPRCDDCGCFHWYPKASCPHCGSQKLRWQAARSSGRLYSWTVLRHAFSDADRDRLPQVLALIEFEDVPGVRLVSRLECGDADLACGTPVVPRFSAAQGDPAPLSFCLASDAETDA